MKTLRLGYIIIFFISLTLTGVMYDFDFISEVSIPIVHKSSIAVRSWEVAMFFFTYISAASFLVVAIRDKFQKMTTVIVLLVHNLLVLFFTIYLLLTFLLVVSIHSFVEQFRMFNPPPQTITHSHWIITVFASIIIAMIVGEGFLIRKALKLNQSR